MIGFSFDDEAKAAQKAADRIAARLITEITKETEAAIRTLIVTVIREGVPPYDAAKLVKQMVGLTSAQGQALLSFRKQLIDSGLAIVKVDDQVEKYSDKLLVSRAETIARSEIMDAINTGQEEAWKQAQAEGVLSDEATKEIILSEDACPVCEAAAAGGPVPVGESFPDGDPPIHPRCRCTIGIAKP